MTGDASWSARSPTRRCDATSASDRADLQRRAIELLEKLLTEHPTFPRCDDALSLLGDLERARGDNRRAAGHDWTLIKQFPNSGHVAEAYLSLAEHFFSEQNPEKARRAYERALESLKPPIAVHVLYRLAWCDYRSGNVDAAVAKLKQVIAEARKSPDFALLERAAGADLARFQGP